MGNTERSRKPMLLTILLLVCAICLLIGFDLSSSKVLLNLQLPKQTICDKANDDDGGVCHPMRSLPHVKRKREYKFPVLQSDYLIASPRSVFQHHQSNQTTIGTTDTVSNFAALPISEHFPHAMQQLLPCWSWFQDNPTLMPVLQESSFSFRKMNLERLSTSQNIILHGSITDLISLGVHIVTVDNVTSSNTSAVTPVVYTWGNAYHVGHTDHVIKLASSIQKLHRICDRKPCHQTVPRIGILNRNKKSHKKRSLLNAKEIAESIPTQAYPAVFPSSFHPTPPIQITSFEHASYAKQVSFVSSVDLLISPHGAQLTSIMFMQSPCGGVLEIFPQGYYLPRFFGSLAEVSSLEHHSL